MTTVISKTTLSSAPPEQVSAHVAQLATFPLRALAVHLADDPALTVSVITYQDGTAELEVLNTGSPCPAPQGTSPPRLPPADHHEGRSLTALASDKPRDNGSRYLPAQHDQVGDGRIRARLVAACPARLGR